MSINMDAIKAFEDYLTDSEKARATIKKYVYAAEQLSWFLGDQELCKARILEYREQLLKSRKAQTVNTALSAINAFLEFYGRTECKVKLLRIQRQAFLDERRELSHEEYSRLLAAAKGRRNERLYLTILTLCGTGIRIGELQFITVEFARTYGGNLAERKAELRPANQRRLLKYAKANGIERGHIFRTRSGRPLDRSNVCHDMKKLCRKAGVDSRKVFPHSLRHLFARSFIAVEKNLAHLADILGHSRIETTRIYVAVSAASHERILQRMNLIL
ncbi:MAG: tyrosine-type recombinase/integrase [Flavonifractor plautii]